MYLAVIVVGDGVRRRSVVLLYGSAVGAQEPVLRSTGLKGWGFVGTAERAVPRFPGGALDLPSYGGIPSLCGRRLEEIIEILTRLNLLAV